MGANQHAFAALDAKLLVPNGNFLGDVALFPLRGAGRESSIHRKCADGQGVSAAGDDGAQHVANKCRRSRGNGRQNVEAARRATGNGNLEQIRQSVVHGGEISFDDSFAALAVSLANRFPDGFDGLFARQHAADGKEASLHDGVDAAAHSGIARDFVSVDDEKLQALLDDGFLR